MPELTAQKNALRRSMRATLGALDAENMRAQSAAMCNKVVALNEFKAAELILCYRALQNECDPKEIAARAAEQNKRVAYPRCLDGGRLQLLVPLDERAFTMGRYGISEPDPARSSEVRMADVALVIVPGVAFDAQRRRLGHGAGYYDRLLAGANATLVGIAFDEQMVDAVPCGALDARMDYVVSNKWIYCK